MKRTLVVSLALLLAGASTVAQEKPAKPAMNRIEREVRHEILMLPNFGVFDNVAFKVNGFNVTLYGSVTQPVLKSEVENVVRSIEGVETVDNRIEVLPLSP